VKVNELTENALPLERDAQGSSPLEFVALSAQNIRKLAGRAEALDFAVHASVGTRMLIHPREKFVVLSLALPLPIRGDKVP
jgi:hypothetical protein